MVNDEYGKNRFRLVLSQYHRICSEGDLEFEPQMSDAKYGC
jgi:hypothetical protein